MNAKAESVFGVGLTTLNGLVVNQIILLKNSLVKVHYAYI